MFVFIHLSTSEKKRE